MTQVTAMTVPVSEGGCVPLSVLPLPPGEDVNCLVPPDPECPVKPLTEVAEGGLGGGGLDDDGVRGIIVFIGVGARGDKVLNYQVNFQKWPK